MTTKLCFVNKANIFQSYILIIACAKHKDFRVHRSCNFTRYLSLSLSLSPHVLPTFVTIVILAVRTLFATGDFRGQIRCQHVTDVWLGPQLCPLPKNHNNNNVNKYIKL